MLKLLIKTNLVVLLTILSIVTTNCYAVSTSTKIGLSVIISGTQNCDYIVQAENRNAKTYSQSSHCVLSNNEERSTTENLLEQASIFDGKVRMTKTIQ